MICDPTWLYIKKGDDSHIYDECGSCFTLSPKHFVLPFGKYEGKNLDEIDDEWYLNFLLNMAVEKGDWFQECCVRLKLQK